MDFNDLLKKQQIDPENVLVFRHRPFERRLRDRLPWLAQEKPDVFNAYQQTQGEKVENAMKTAPYVASFIGQKAGKALFVGLYEVGESKPMTREEYWHVPAYMEMKELGMQGFSEKSDRSSCLWFDLKLTDFYQNWKGKLEIKWPPPERSWWRRAHRNNFEVAAILEVNALCESLPAWDEIVLDWIDISLLPLSWRSALNQWRGIYYIRDTSDGKGYVGSAYGGENLLGRWLHYAASGHGGNKFLRGRDPKNFRFSILELVSPILESEKVIERENSWKERLHTRGSHGLNDN